MNLFLFLAAIFVSVLQTVCSAQATIASNWTNPNAQLPSFSSTYLLGETIILSWLSLNKSRDDLWLIRYDRSVDNYSLRIATDLDLSIDSSFPWTVAVSSEVILEDTRFVFEFLPSGSIYNAEAQLQLQSPAFNIMLVNQNTGPNGTVGATTSLASSTSTVTPASATSNSNITSTTSTDPHPHGYAGFSSGAITGTAIAAFILVGIIGFVVGCLVVRKKQSRHNQKINLGGSDSHITLNGPYEILGDRKQPIEMNGKESQLHELTGSKESMVQMPEAVVVHEASTTVKRPGLHEMPG